MIIRLNGSIVTESKYIAVKNWLAQKHLMLPLMRYDVINYFSESIEVRQNINGMPESTKGNLYYLVKPFAIPNRYYRLITDRELEYVNAFLLIDKEMPLGLYDANTKLRFEILRRKILEAE